MKKIIILLTSMLLSSSVVNAEEKKTLADLVGDGGCIEEHKISPKAFGCSIKRLFKKKDGSPNAVGTFYNANTLEDLWKK